MATVEQRDTQQPGLATLSNTLDLFNDFKDDKDSDEESFHLPMLDCDDDLESSNKENLSNSTEKDVQHGETEDEILNKFETTGTPDIDPKIEDKLLDEIDEVCGKKADEESAEISSSPEIASQNLQNNEENNSEVKVGEKTDFENKEISSDDQKDDICLPESEHSNSAKDNEENENDKQEEGYQKAASEEKNVFEKECAASQEVELNEQVDKDKPTRTENNIENNAIAEVETNKNNADVGEGNDELNDNKNIASDVKNEDIKKDEDLLNVEEKPGSSMDNNETVEHENNLVKDNVTEEIPESQKENKMEVDEITENTQPLTITDEDTLRTTNDFVEDVSNELENDSQKKDNVLKQDSESKCMDLELPESDTKENTVSKLVDNSNDKEVSAKKNVINDIVMEDDSSQCKKNDASKLKDNKKQGDLPNEEMRKKEENKPEEFATNEFDKPKDTIHSKSENEAQEKYENCNGFNKNNDCEDDLLDISIIRDADEDNASAIAENANDNHSSEKSDNDEQEEGSEKAENEESEMDQDESSLVNDKDDHMDFDEGNSSNIAYQENSVSGNTSDSEAKDDDTRDSENESNNSSVLKEKTNRINGIIASEKNQTDAITTEIKDADGAAAAVDQDSHKENSVKLGSKRLLTDTESPDATNKKIKLADNAAEITEKKKSKKVKTLVSFEKFMQSKKIEKKLTRSDLEQFCLQKICEAIVHKTDVGELHQTIKKQEQIIENLRKDIQQLTKQTRDLDIVNKKLMNELRAQNGIKKPLVPLKITRSVGLQVKLNIGSDNNRRKTLPAPNSRTPNANNSPRQRPVVAQNANVVRQIAASPRKAPTSTPILSQALQSTRQTIPAPVVKRPPIRPKPAEPQKPANPGVIDLTDEDDKASKTAAGAKLVKTNLSQTKNANQNKTVPGKTMNTNNQNKTVAIGQVKATTVGSKVTTPTRTVTALPQGVRLTPTQVKNGSITIPASVVTSSAGTTQLMYVVQPTSSLGPVVTTTAGGTQKAVLLNFQSANGVLTSTLNGSAVSVIPTKTTNTVQLKTVAAPRKHPAPLPLPPPVVVNASLKPLLPKPHLSIRKTDTGIILQWRMPYNLDIYEGIASYQLFAYQETNAAPSTDMWRKVGDVKALALPMACTLTQFADKNKYYFAVRSVDVHKRIGAFSDPEEISL